MNSFKRWFKFAQKHPKIFKLVEEIRTRDSIRAEGTRNSIINSNKMGFLFEKENLLQEFDSFIVLYGQSNLFGRLSYESKEKLESIRKRIEELHKLQEKLRYF